MTRSTPLAAALALLLLAALPARALHEPEAERGAGTVTRLADGVYFMEAQTTPEFHGSNSGWVIFDDYVLVIDAGFPLSARGVVEEVKKTTDKPIRFVFDTHYHGDHSFGNGVYVDSGATGVAQALCLRDMREKNPAAFAAQAESKSDLARRQVADARWRDATIAFGDRMEFDDGKRRVELIWIGHAHTPGDAVAWLPKEKILFTGDACVNGAFNYMGDGDSESWVKALDWLGGLGAATIAPGHGPVAPGDLIGKQKRYFAELRAHVSSGLDKGLPAAEIQSAFDLPWYREWTGKDSKDQAAHVARVYDEISGRVPPAYLVRDLELVPGPSPTKDSPGWKPPKKVVVPALAPERLARLRAVAPGVELVPAANAAAAAAAAAGADAVIGHCSREIVAAGGKDLRWIQVGHAGVERYVGIPELAGPNSTIALTNAQRLYGPEIADHALAMILAVTRNLRTSIPAQAGERPWETIRRGDESKMTELAGKVALVAGLGGIGTEVAKRLHGCGMTVLATRNRAAERPPYVHRLGLSADTRAMAAEADLVVNCLPLTKETQGLFDAALFASLKKGAIYANVGRGKTTDTAALVAALESGKLAGAALDVTDPEPLPDGHALWTMPNVVVTPHNSAASDKHDERLYHLYRENLRRFAAGEALLSVVSLERGY